MIGPQCVVAAQGQSRRNVPLQHELRVFLALLGNIDALNLLTTVAADDDKVAEPATRGNATCLDDNLAICTLLHPK
jgi:hypothetical protein